MSTETLMKIEVVTKGLDGCHLLVATLGENEIHRDHLLIDRADERRKFADAIVSKVPAITDDAELAPEDIDAELIALASRLPPSIEWEKPVSIEHPELPGFPVDALPHVLASWVREESEATQTPPDMAALLALAVCAAALSKRVTIETWAGWSEPCNLYVAAILGPANRKSSVFADATRPLREIELRMRSEQADAVAEELSNYRQTEKRLAKLERVAGENNNAVKRDEAKQEARELSKVLAAWEEPQLPTVIVDDATSEKVAMLLQANDERLASMSAEGGVFDLMAGKYAKSGTADFNVYLTGHSGDAVSVHRVGRQAVHLQSPALTMAFAIQPEVIRGISDNPAFRGRGLLGRFLYAIPKSLIGKRRIRTSPVSEIVEHAYSHTIKTFVGITPDPDDTPYRIRLSREAEALFQDFNERIEAELGSGSLVSLEDWGGKLAGATLRIAGILHCATRVGDPRLNVRIEPHTMESAIRIAKWSIPHATAVLDLFGASPEKTTEDARYLLNWLRKRGKRETNFDRRDANRHGHRRFTGQPQRLDSALELLETTNHIIRLDGSKKGGRVTYAVSPYVASDNCVSDMTKSGDNGDNKRLETLSSPSLSPLSPDSVADDNEIELTI